MEGMIYLEHPAPAVSLDSWPMEGEVINQKLEWEPVITPADSYYLDSRPMEGMTYLEHPAPGVSLDSSPMEGVVIKQKSEWEPVITPADSYTLDSRPMEGMTYLEHPAAVYLDSWLVRGASYPRPHVNWEVVNSKPSVNNVTIVKIVDTNASDDVNTQLPENAPPRIDPNMSRENSPEYVTPVSTPTTTLVWTCVKSPRLPTLKPEIVDRMMDSRAVNSTQPESSHPTTDSDLSNENWEDGDCRLLEYAGH